MSLTVRQRTKINALLCCAHGHGHDASAINAAAKANLVNGDDHRLAFEKAINAFVARNPDIGPALTRISNQVNATDEPTLARYDAALTEYIATGNENALAAVDGVATRDAVEMAVRSGELRREDVEAGRIDWDALGMDGDTAAVSYGTPDPVAEAAPAATPAKASFAFNTSDRYTTPQPATAPESRATAPTAARGDGSSFSYRSTPTGEQAARWAGVPLGAAGVRTESGGYRAPMTGEKAARWAGVPLAVLPGHSPEQAAS